MQQAQLESLPATRAGTFPAAEDAPLARALLGLLASGSPMTPAELAEATRRPIGGLPEPAQERSLARGRPRLPSRVTPATSTELCFRVIPLASLCYRFARQGQCPGWLAGV